LIEHPILETRNLWISYSGKPAVKDVSLRIPERRITAIIGPSGCGKSTLLRHFNRMNEFIQGVTTEGEILYRGQHLYAKANDPVEVRRRIGMVFQKPNPFPKSVADNVAWGPRINGLVAGKHDAQALVERSLRQAGLWDEVRERLHHSGLGLSGGQQQRLCIARALAMEPEIVLMDRGPAVRAEGALHDRHCHAQYAAGGARQRLHGVPGERRVGRVRADAAGVHQPQA
jgi:phosphate transport system ATP-binding protein